MGAVRHEVDRERSVERHPDDRARTSRTTGPATPHAFRGHGLELEHVRQARRGREGIVPIVPGVADGRESSRNVIKPVLADLVEADVLHGRVGQAADDGAPFGTDDDDRRAFLRQRSLALVDADAVDTQGGAVPEHAGDARVAPQAPCTVPDDHHVRREADTSASGRRGVRFPIGDELDQLGHTPPDRIGIVTDQRPGILAERGRGVRQPGHPAPVAVPLTGCDQDELDVARALQHRELRHQPLRHRARPIGTPGDTNDTGTSEGYRHRDIVDDSREPTAMF